MESRLRRPEPVSSSRTDSGSKNEEETNGNGPHHHLDWSVVAGSMLTEADGFFKGNGDVFSAPSVAEYEIKS